MKKNIGSGRYHNDNIFKIILGHQKEISVKRCFEHLFMYLHLLSPDEKNNIDFPLNAIFFI